jgi:hypothetical protein
VQDVVCVPDSINPLVTKDGPNYPVHTHHKPTPIFITKREFVKMSWIFCTPILATNLPLHIRKPALIREKKYCELASPSSTD